MRLHPAAFAVMKEVDARPGIPQGMRWRFQEALMSGNKRTRSRVAAAFEAVITLAGDRKKYPVQTRNLSLKGMLCDAETQLAGKKKCVVTFVLNSEVSFQIEANIMRCDAQGLAIDFEGMDETAFMHLRNLVRFQAEDPDAIDRELSVPAFKAHR